MKKKRPGIYALYQGDKFIDEGTVKELAEKLGIKKETLYFYATPSYRKRKNFNKNRGLA